MDDQIEEDNLLKSTIIVEHYTKDVAIPNYNESEADIEYMRL